MRYNKTGSVPRGCNLNKLMQSVWRIHNILYENKYRVNYVFTFPLFFICKYEPGCCPIADSQGQLILRTSAYPLAFSCLAYVGCSDSIVAQSLTAECQSVCSNDPTVCTSYPNYNPIVALVCFHGSEVIRMENNKKKSISDIRIGDRVLVSDGKSRFSFANVIAVPHKNNFQPAKFSHITVTSGLDIRLTPNHLILVAHSCKQGSDVSLIQAMSVRVGSCVVTINGLEVVTDNHVVFGHGVYSFVTDGLPYLVVSDIVASPFAVSHTVGSVFYSVYSLGFSISPSLFKSAWFSTSFDTFSSFVSHMFSFFVVTDWT